ncbi:Uncharacterized protein YP598_0805 [Yersinia pseudotuberculosis]|uniref:Uncharacterized protein n=1 Tax=Yersinia pseudotuberculosis serotype O:1b (strain IP 31758) TaxID=349747 RepID=A0A0U1QVY8_YERP3|nr:hypothetical protein [Yersinia similis]ABS46697.1 hypothetical protein YpsIP31758_0783 [Yersinia pseudotuberculosis IP 31758]UFA60430.1 Uncharacterized protein YP598_0805 [Yersinia pseudotuberculosis]
MSEGLTAPRGAPVAYATTTPTARFPFNQHLTLPAVVVRGYPK